MATNKTSNYSVGKDPIELCRPENSEELQKISMVRNQRCSDTKHPSQSSNSISKNLLCSYKHNIVCKRPICSWQIEANERSDWSLSKHYTINSFSTKVLKIQNNLLCSGLRLKTKLRKKKRKCLLLVPTLLLGLCSWHGMRQENRWARPCPLPLISWSCLPSLKPAQTGQHGSWELCRQPCVQRVNRHAAHRACLSGEQSITIQFAAQIAAALNAEFPSGLKMPQKGQQSKPWQPDMRGVRGRQTYRPTAATQSCWWWPGPWAETAAIGSTAPAGERTGLGAAALQRGQAPRPQLYTNFLCGIKREASWQLWFKLMKLIRRIHVKEGQAVWAHVAADPRQAFSFPVVTPLV